MQPTPIEIQKRYCIAFAKKQFQEIVYNFSVQENLPFTFPEIQTLLEGITVGGRRLEEQDIVRSLKEAIEYVFNSVEADAFQVSKATAVEINRLVARNETLEVGAFRHSQVFISGTEYRPPAAEELEKLFEELLAGYQAGAEDREMLLFLTMARNQFFFDGNKRTGQLMMNGARLLAGLPWLSVPAKERLRFNETMLAFYESGDPAAMISFLKEIEAPLLELVAESSRKYLEKQADR